MSHLLNKKALIFLIVLLAGIAGLLAYLNFTGVDNFVAERFQRAQIAENGSTFESKLDPEAIKRPIALSKHPVLSPTFSNDSQKILYYTSPDGRAYEARIDGSELKQISDDRLSDLLKVLWSPNKHEVIGFYNTGGVVEKRYFNYETKKSAVLDENIYDLAFSPDGTTVAYSLFDAATARGGIYIAKPDGSFAKEIFSTRLKNARIGWMNDALLYFYKDAKEEAIDVFILDIETGGLTTFIETVELYDMKFAPDRKTMLFYGAQLFDKEPGLMVKRLNEEIEPLDISVPARACAWASDSVTIFCSLSDGFWQINMQNGEKTKFFSDLNFAADTLLLSPLENYLVFINKKDGLLYSLPL